MRFPEGNTIIYSQDFRIWEGLPSDVDFEVHPVSRDGVKLVAPGYGGKPYGNGAIYVSRGMNELPAAPLSPVTMGAGGRDPDDELLY